LAIDANFRLKQKEKGVDMTQSLTAGWGYFVDPFDFGEGLLRAQQLEPQATSEKETCESSFAAIERANTRMNRGFAVTGVVAAIDSRHGMLLPTSVANLQKGERCGNNFLLSFLILPPLKVL
jgi:hypothetical protein